MKIFVTGASGWIGLAVVPELTRAGHTVVGLARSDKSAEVLEDAGAEVVRGTIDDLEILRHAARRSDGVIHLAFKHELAFSGDFQGAAEADRLAVDALGEALAGSDKPFVIASGLLGLTPGRVATESDGHAENSESDHDKNGPEVRHATAEAVLALASRGVRSSIVRLPPTVHGDGDNGFMAMIVKIAQSTGVSRYVGEGVNRWPAVHRQDAAVLFRLAVEHAPSGSTLHAVAEEGVSIRDIATVIGKHLNLPVETVSSEDAAQQFTWLAGFLAIDSPASSRITRKLLEWQPEHPGLIADLDDGHYFKP
jgi:nucleoside-diphosphate-sugar epimerase